MTCIKEAPALSTQLLSLLCILAKDKTCCSVYKSVFVFQEFRKEVENQLPLKDKVLSVGKQLLQNQVYQTADLDERLKHLELEWAHLEHDITNSEEYLHQAQMDLMPSRQALGELNAWLTEIEETLQEEKTKPMKNMADIEVLLKKYKVDFSDLKFFILHSARKI